MPVLVSIFTPRMLQDARLTGIVVQRNQSTPTAAKDVKICGNALATPQVSNQRPAGASAPYDSALQDELERHGDPLPVHEEMRMAHCAAISRAIRIEDAHSPATNHDRPREGTDK